MYNCINSTAFTCHEDDSSFLQYEQKTGIIDGFFRSIFNNTAVAFALINKNGIIIIVNKSFCNFLGFSQEEIAGTSLLSYLEDDQEDIHLSLDNLKGNNYIVEKRFRRGDGETVWGRLHFSLIKENNNKCPNIIIICEDITLQKARENEIQAMQSIYQTMLGALKEISISPDRIDGIHTLADLGICLQTSGDEQLIAERILDVVCDLTGTCGALYGYDESQKSLLLIKLLGLSEFGRNRISRFALGEERGLVGRVAETRKPLYIPDVAAEPKWVYIDSKLKVRSCYMLPVYYSTTLFGVILLFSPHLDGFSLQKRVLADRIVFFISLSLENTRFFTEIKRIYYKLNIIQKQLLQEQKMDAIGQLAGGMAHDINNQMTIIQACVDLCKANPEKINIDSILQKIDKAAKYSANLTRQLMFFSRKQPQFKTMINLNLNVICFQNILKYMINDNIEINMELEPNLSMIYADNSGVNQIIMNLVLNARDAMPDGGLLTIKTANIEYKQITPPPDVQKSHPSNYVCLSVEDVGLGIEEEMITHLFEPFFTTKEVNKGIGIGLSVVYGITKAHDGWVNVVSKPGKGSTFNIYFPAAEQKQ